MASTGRLARCCVRSASGLIQSQRQARVSGLVELSRSIATTPKRTATAAASGGKPATSNGNGNGNGNTNGNGNGSAKTAASNGNKNGYVRNQNQAQNSKPAAPAQKPATKPAPKPASTPVADAIDDQSPIKDMQGGLSDQPLILDEGSRQVDWTRSFHGLSAQPFSKEAADILLADIKPDDIEVKPDGIVYLPEIKYRRILNRAFGPGGWGLAPRGETIVTPKSITREYALVAHGRLVSVARGEQQYFSAEGIPTATEGCKSNALMRCCKDLGIASELWDPRFIRKFMKKYAKQIWVEHIPTKKKKQIWLRVDDEAKYPFKEVK